MHSHSSVSRALFACSLPLAISAPASAGDLEIIDVTTGFCQLLPHRIFELDANGQPTANIIDIRSLDDLVLNVTPSNGVHGVPSLPTGALLPSGAPGNQFIAVRFNRALDVSSIISSVHDQTAANQLTGAISVNGALPTTSWVFPLAGRAFVGGRTYAGTSGSTHPEQPLQQWFTNSGGMLVPNPAIDNDGDGVPDGLGFPGTVTGFQGSELLARDNVFVFVADSDGDLQTYETFGIGLEIVIEITEQVLSRNGQGLQQTSRVSTRLGPNTMPPEIRLLGTTPPILDVTPADGALDVDPLTTLTLRFSEAIQPSSVGRLKGSPATSSQDSALTISAGAGQQVLQIPFTVLPVSAYDLSTLVLYPGFPLPGKSSTSGNTNGMLNLIRVHLASGQLSDLADNQNALATEYLFNTGFGPGLTNAPVTPDAIYAGLTGQMGALSVIDLNGFGQGTGNPAYDFANPVIEGNSNFPNNPNVAFMGPVLRPPLQPGLTTSDGGSSGVFSRTRDSNLDANLAQSPYLLDVSDMALGRALDTTFNNAPAPFGCQAGGGNLCATNGRKSMNVTFGGSATTSPMMGTGQLLNSGLGTGNTVAWAPHPNPPALQFPPICVSPHIGGQEPTSIFNILPPPPASPPNGLGIANLLLPGDPFGNPDFNQPPSGLLSSEQNAFFVGPHAPQPVEPACLNYMVRQQIGQFLYVVDRVRNQVVVLNSNRMTPIERIQLPDPARMALSPNLDFLAVTNQRTGTVSFININPTSATFHQVVKETPVGRAPLGIAWESMNEDILVCNERSDDISIISAFDLEVRKVVNLPQMKRPFDVVITPRQTNFGYLRDVYFGYVISRDGRLSVFESGPGGVSGWGFDDMIGSARYRFHNPKAIAVDVQNTSSGVWVAHEGEIDLISHQSAPAGTGALTRLGLLSSNVGPQMLLPNETPNFRNMEVIADVSLGASVLTGIPTDIAFDNLRNMGSLPNLQNPFSAGAPIAFNGKTLVRDASGIRAANLPNYMFVAVPNSTQGNSGVVDVIDLNSIAFNRQDTNVFQPGVQSLPMPGVSILADYFRQ